MGIEIFSATLKAAHAKYLSDCGLTGKFFWCAWGGQHLSRPRRCRSRTAKTVFKRLYNYRPGAKWVHEPA